MASLSCRRVAPLTLFPWERISPTFAQVNSAFYRMGLENKYKLRLTSNPACFATQNYRYSWARVCVYVVHLNSILQYSSYTCVRPHKCFRKMSDVLELIALECVRNLYAETSVELKCLIGIVYYTNKCSIGRNGLHHFLHPVNLMLSNIYNLSVTRIFLSFGSVCRPTGNRF